MQVIVWGEWGVYGIRPFGEAFGQLASLRTLPAKSWVTPGATCPEFEDVRLSLSLGMLVGPVARMQPPEASLAISCPALHSSSAQCPLSIVVASPWVPALHIIVHGLAHGVAS